MKISIELNEKQNQEFQKWCDSLKVIFGQVGTLTWSITSTGIGDIIKVSSDNIPDKPLDLTDVDSW